MKYNAQAHLEDINAELTALMLDLGLDPSNIDNTNLVDFKTAIQNTYFLDAGPMPDDPDVDNNPKLAILFQRSKSIVNARKLVYLRKIVLGRV